MLASSLFYECTLLSQTKRETHPKAPYPLIFACTSMSKNSYSDCHPENEEEAKLLIDKLVEFIRTWINPPKEQIGVLASTKQQVRWSSYYASCAYHTIEFAFTYRLHAFVNTGSLRNCMSCVSFEKSKLLYYQHTTFKVCNFLVCMHVHGCYTALLIIIISYR